jgi:hypothetical protein
MDPPDLNLRTKLRIFMSYEGQRYRKVNREAGN